MYSGGRPLSVGITDHLYRYRGGDRCGRGVMDGGHRGGHWSPHPSSDRGYYNLGVTLE